MPRPPAIVSVKYRYGMIDAVEDATSLKAHTLAGAGLTVDLVKTIADIIPFAGTCGDPRFGDPIEFDELTITNSRGTAKITVYNRAIMLFSTEHDGLRAIHQVCCRLQTLIEARRETPASEPRSCNVLCAIDLIPTSRSEFSNAFGC